MFYQIGGIMTKKQILENLKDYYIPFENRIVGSLNLGKYQGFANKITFINLKLNDTDSEKKIIVEQTYDLVPERFVKTIKPISTDVYIKYRDIFDQLPTSNDFKIYKVKVYTNTPKIKNYKDMQAFPGYTINLLANCLELTIYYFTKVKS